MRRWLFGVCPHCPSTSGEGARPVWTNTTLDCVSLTSDATLTLTDLEALRLETFTSGTGALTGGVSLKDGAVWQATAAGTSAAAFAISGEIGSEGAWTLVVEPADGAGGWEARRKETGDDRRRRAARSHSGGCGLI